MYDPGSNHIIADISRGFLSFSFLGSVQLYVHTFLPYMRVQILVLCLWRCGDAGFWLGGSWRGSLLGLCDGGMIGCV